MQSKLVYLLNCCLLITLYLTLLTAIVTVVKLKPEIYNKLSNYPTLLPFRSLIYFILSFITLFTFFFWHDLLLQTSYKLFPIVLTFSKQILKIFILGTL